jgi:RNA polymerase sigma-70 factor (ECF subfamily)
MELSDNQTVRQVKKGDIEAYSEIVARYQKRIFNLMYRFSWSKADAAELTQDVFCKAFERLASFKNDRQFFPWLYTLAMNHGRDWSRQQAKKRDGLRLYADSLKQEDWSFATKTIEKRQEIAQMLKAISNLPHEKRELLLR